MRNIFIVLLFVSNIIIAPCSALADSSEINNLATDTLSRKINRVKSFIDYFFGDWDTLYVSPNKYNFALLTNYMTNSEYFNLKSTSPDNQKLQLFHPPQDRIGFYIGWQFLFLGWSFSIENPLANESNIDNGSSFQLSLYSSKLGLDLMQIKTGNNFRIHNFKGVEYPLYRADRQFGGLSAVMRGANLYYILNNKRFSYPAAFSQTTVQRRSSGSGLIGLSLSTHKIYLDESKIPIWLNENLNSNMKFGTIRFTNLSLSFGYAYNWVISRNVLFSVSASPVLVYKIQKEVQSGDYPTGFFRNINVDLLLRTGLVYNNGKYYFGSSFLGQIFNFRQKDFQINYGYGSLQIYAGFNFYIKKEYKNQKP